MFGHTVFLATAAMLTCCLFILFVYFKGTLEAITMVHSRSCRTGVSVEVGPEIDVRSTSGQDDIQGHTELLGKLLKVERCHRKGEERVAKTLTLVFILV